MEISNNHITIKKLKNMKKYFILAAAALVALTACTKMETTETAEKKISFEVANYSAQTKAEEPVSVLTEIGVAGFKTKAWLHANGGSGSNFFGTSDNGYTETITYNGSNAWEPALEYFWPKASTSYINFVSWFAKNDKAPKSSTLSETVMEWGDNTNPLTILPSDNILFADEAWKQTDNNTTPTTPYYHKDGVTQGVPTLFHHALASVAFSVRLSTQTASTKSIWDVTIDAASLTVGNNGYLTLSNSEPTGKSTRAWRIGSTYQESESTLATSANVGWARPTSGASTETIVQTGGTGTEEFATPAFTGFQPTTATSSAPATSGDYVTLLPPRTVMPQVINGGVVTFSLTFTIKIFHDNDSNGVKDEFDGTSGITDGDAFSRETITVSDNLYSLVNSISAWNMNTKYTYRITIDPVGQKVLFDPAVADWATVANGEYTGTQVYP